MAFFIGLLIMYALAWLVSLTGISSALQNLIAPGIWAAGIMYVLVGISHFAKRDKLEAMIPESWPYRRALNYISGAAEIILGAGLFFESTKYFAAVGLIALMIAVFPANIHVAIKKPDVYNISRLFFQPVYLLWIYRFCIASGL